MKVDGFDWDSGNSFKNEAKHGISRETVEAFSGRNVRVAPDPKHSRTEDCFMHAREIAKYDQAFAKDEK